MVGFSAAGRKLLQCSLGDRRHRDLDPRDQPAQQGRVDDPQGPHVKDDGALVE